MSELDKIYYQIKISSTHPVRDRAIFETSFASGIRSSELAHLDVGDIDFEGRMLTVRQGKGNKDRRVPIAARACYWIERYLIEVRPKLAHPSSGETPFLSKEGTWMRRYQLGHVVKKYMQKVGIHRHGACNLLRHATATLMHENGADIRHIQSMLGHSDISTTQVYTHVSPNKLKEVYFKTHPYAQDKTGEQRHE
ncbi:tyrosine-type recombinase/integrase [Kangiella shandongensis]|uniref:tyrosine-type recombinase/integrase n=1 Tax=Kangiella shandongensis TaxID=2763258 RepID=UPI001CBE2BF5|nr:tyrosine-type recombinase/integrase [Kangiella shandongensis]